ncbi:putative quinol monooxygenase [Vibrio renipiscarius]|uniref:putative quinol monooxygenase n=1 Tax=Vibrio renipiscarius TaxID=1461322 RepID=UPI00354AE0C3
MANLTIVANIVAQPDHVEFVKSELLKLIEITRTEEGCINYDLHQDNENPAHFVFYENWASEALLQTHLNNDHLAAYMKATEGAVASFTINRMTKLG